MNQTTNKMFPLNFIDLINRVGPFGLLKLVKKTETRAGSPVLWFSPVLKRIPVEPKLRLSSQPVHDSIGRSGPIFKTILSICNHRWHTPKPSNFFKMRKKEEELVMITKLIPKKPLLVYYPLQSQVLMSPAFHPQPKSLFDLHWSKKTLTCWDSESQTNIVELTKCHVCM